MRRAARALVACLGLLPAVLGAQAPDPRLSAPLTLLEAIRLGRERAVAARVARTTARIAESRITQRRADLLPTVTGTLAATRQTLNLDEFGIPVATGVTEPFSIVRARLNAQQVLFDAAAVQRLRAARDTAAAADLDARTAGSLAGAAAGLAWLRLEAARATVAARLADSTVAADLVAQAEQLVAAGVSPAIDATRSRVNLAAIRTQLAQARNLVERATLDLRRALDLEPSAPLAITDSLEDGAPLPADPAEAEAYALAHRPELAAERARRVAADRALNAVRREWLPSVVAGAFVQQSGRSVGGAATTWTAQVGVAFPVFDGLRRESRRDEQAIRRDVQALREHDVARRIATEARQAVTDLASAGQQVALAEERLQLAEQELAQAQERFAAGVAGSIETTTAQGGLLAARDARIQARIALGSARVDAWRALGLLETLP